MKRNVLLMVLVLLFTCSSFADLLTLQWDANTEPDLAGYKIYYSEGKNTGAPYQGKGIKLNGAVVDSPIDVGNVTEVTLDVPAGKWFTFSATAYDNETPRLESDYSNEVVWASFDGVPPEKPSSFEWLKELVGKVTGWMKKLMRISS